MPTPHYTLFQVFFDGVNVRQVDVPTLTGAFGILASHVPTLQVLRPGLVVVHAEDGTTTKYFGECGPGEKRLRSPQGMEKAKETNLHRSPRPRCSHESWPHLSRQRHVQVAVEVLAFRVGELQGRTKPV